MADFDPVGTIEFFRERHRIEAATTARVLGALPADMLSYRPHPDSSTAGTTAWTIVRCLRICNELTYSSMSEVSRDTHPAYAVLVSQFEQTSQVLGEALLGMTQKDWKQERVVISNGTEILREPLGQIFWLFLFDGIHHRGQLSTYLRPLGAKVPSIYGPSRDAPV